MLAHYETCYPCVHDSRVTGRQKDPQVQEFNDHGVKNVQKMSSHSRTREQWSSRDVWSPLAGMRQYVTISRDSSQSDARPPWLCGRRGTWPPWTPYNPPVQLPACWSGKQEVNNMRYSKFQVMRQTAGETPFSPRTRPGYVV